MLLKEVSSGGSESANMVVDMVLAEAPLLRFMHFFVEPGGAASLRKDADVNAQAGFRALNEDYVTSAQGDPALAAFALKIFGKTLKVDRAYERRGVVKGGADPVVSELMRQLRAFARTLGKNLQEYLVTGDTAVSVKQFNGLKKTVAGLAETQTLTEMGENGMQILTGTTDAAKKSQQAFVEALNTLISSVSGGAQCVVLNSRVISRLSTIAKDNVSTTKDEFGRQITMFNDVPIVHAGYKYDGSEILPLSETKGTSTDCTTAYALRTEEAAYWSFMTTPGGLSVYDAQLVGNFYEQTVELQLDSGEPFNPRSIACLPGIRIG
jgi:hypothetical protein